METPPEDQASTSTPADDKLLLAFLRRKLAGEPLPATAAHFHDADIYSADPATLTAGYEPAPARNGGEGGSSWFFFTHVRPKSRSDRRKSRMVGGGVGTWHSERAPRPVLDGEGNYVGHGQCFSYKRRTGNNRSERTDWYMVEFTEGRQGGDHDRVHGGEPVLVLCNIYKARSGSRSSSSRSARKCKATDDEHVDQSSAPVKAKRRLFEPPAAPISAAASQLSSRVWYELPASQDMVTGPRPEASKGEAAESDSKIGDTSDYCRFWPEPEASQGEIDGTSDYLQFSHEPEELTSTTPSSLPSMFEPEVPAVQSETAMFDWGIQMDGCGPPVPAHCYGMTDLLMNDGYSSGFAPLWGRDGWFSASWTGNEVSCCRDLGWLVGAPPRYEQWSTTEFSGAPNMCTIPATALLPPSLSPSSWFGAPDLWSC